MKVQILSYSHIIKKFIQERISNVKKRQAFQLMVLGKLGGDMWKMKVDNSLIPYTEIN